MKCRICGGNTVKRNVCLDCKIKYPYKATEPHTHRPPFNRKELFECDLKSKNAPIVEVQDLSTPRQEAGAISVVSERSKLPPAVKKILDEPLGKKYCPGCHKVEIENWRAFCPECHTKWCIAHPNSGYQIGMFPALEQLPLRLCNAKKAYLHSQIFRLKLLQGLLNELHSQACRETKGC